MIMIMTLMAIKITITPIAVAIIVGEQVCWEDHLRRDTGQVRRELSWDALTTSKFLFKPKLITLLQVILLIVWMV